MASGQGLGMIRGAGRGYCAGGGATHGRRRVELTQFIEARKEWTTRHRQETSLKWQMDNSVRQATLSKCGV